jgi:hypothetical protein
MGRRCGGGPDVCARSCAGAPAILTPVDADDFEDLSRPGGARGAGKLADELAAALGEPLGGIEVVPEDDEMGWIVRDGVRLSQVNLRALGGIDPERHARFVQALAGLVMRFDEQRATIETLEIGRSYVVDYKNAQLRRTFRVRGELLEVSPWHPADGPTGGGWTLTLESRPRFGEPSSFTVQTDVLMRIVPA